MRFAESLSSSTRWWIPAALVVVLIATLAAAVWAVEHGDEPGEAPPDMAIATLAAGAVVESATSDEGLATSEPRGEGDAQIALQASEPEEAGSPPNEPLTPDAEPLVFGLPLLGSLSGGQSAAYRVDGEAGSLVRIRVDGIEAMDPVVRLSDAEGTLLGENDDESSVNSDSLLILRLPADGPYLVEVRPFDLLSGGVYQILAEELPEPPDESGRTIAAGASIEGYLATPDDRDEFFVDLAAGETLSAQADGELGTDTYLEVFGPDGGFVSADDDSGHGLDGAVRFTSQSGGRYRLEVSVVSAKLGAYRLALEVDVDESVPPGIGADATTSINHEAGLVVLDYWNALQRDDVGTLFELAGPEALRLWGWRSIDDVRRDLGKLQSVGVSGFPTSIATTTDGERARVEIALVRGDGLADGTLVADGALVEGRWRVELVSRFFPVSEGGYDGPLPEPIGPPPLRIGTAGVLRIGALTAVVVDADSGTVLYEKDSHRPLPPASLTKIATAILTVEGGDLDRMVEVDVDSGKMAGSSLMGLRPGDEFSVGDLLYGLMLESGNDAALALGRAVAGSDASFVAQLNALLARIGLTDSKLLNPHGLEEAGHRASAYDLAMLSRYGMTFEAFREVVGTVSWTADGSRRIALKNGNAFLGYEGADGVKTGFTNAARETVAASATRGGHRVFVVLLNAPSRFAEAGALLDWVFSNFCWPADGDGVEACRPPNS